MARFLAIFTGAATDEQRGSISDEKSAAFVESWGVWAAGLGPTLIDPGSPLFHKVRLTNDSVRSFEDNKTAYAIIEASSHA